MKPLLKSDTINKDLLRNYRAVSNIAFIGSVLEKSCSPSANRTMNGLHEEYHSAYKTLQSTGTALLRVKHDIAGALDRNHATMFVMLDLSAAFDTIDHAHLSKLLQDEYGACGTTLVWFRAYMEDRTYRVHIPL